LSEALIAGRSNTFKTAERSTSLVPRPTRNSEA
jgi:hypothetical protein